MSVLRESHAQPRGLLTRNRRDSLVQKPMFLVDMVETRADERVELAGDLQVKCDCPETMDTRKVHHHRFLERPNGCVHLATGTLVARQLEIRVAIGRSSCRPRI
jgi:hypothetical protein